VFCKKTEGIGVGVRLVNNGWLLMFVCDLFQLRIGFIDNNSLLHVRPSTDLSDGGSFFEFSYLLNLLRCPGIGEFEVRDKSLYT
jgi:hypothetical protein